MGWAASGLVYLVVWWSSVDILIRVHCVRYSYNIVYTLNIEIYNVLDHSNINKYIMYALAHEYINWYVTVYTVIPYCVTNIKLGRVFRP